MAEDSQDGRLRPDPSVGVFDLEQAIQKYFDHCGCRDMQVVLTTIKNHGTTWSSATKVHPPPLLQIGYLMGPL